MKAFPVVARELRVASRQAATYWNRCLVALAAIATAMLVLFIVQRVEPKETGFFLFLWMSLIAIGYGTFIGFVFTAGALAEEKREGTLGLLFLTDLKGYDIVFGKLAAYSLRGVYGLIAIFPLLGISMLLGGVSPAEFGRVMLVCLNSLFLSLTLGMVASAVCRDEQKALVIAFAIILLLTVVLPAMGAWIKSAAPRNSSLFLPFFWPSPGFSSFHAFDKLYNPRSFWPAILTQHLIAWIALFIACWILPHTCQDKAISRSGERRRLTIRQWIYGLPASRNAFRERLFDINPYYWLTSRDRLKQMLPWIWLGGAGLLWLVGLVQWPSLWRDEVSYIISAFALHALFKTWVAYEASRRLGLDRQSGALELLLCTPLQVPDILRGQWLGLRRQFAAPVSIVLAADIVFFFAGWRPSPSGGVEWVYIWFCGVTVFVADLVALAWVAMWLGFSNRRTGQGGVKALIQIGVLPWLLFALIIAGLAGLEFLRILTLDRIGHGLFGIWWVISIGVDLLFGMNAYHRLHRELRIRATEPYVSRAAIWGRILGHLDARRHARQ